VSVTGRCAVAGGTRCCDGWVAAGTGAICAAGAEARSALLQAHRSRQTTQLMVRRARHITWLLPRQGHARAQFASERECGVSSAGTSLRRCGSIRCSEWLALLSSRRAPCSRATRMDQVFEVLVIDLEARFERAIGCSAAALEHAQRFLE
jgi:hypothetical protein